MRFLILLIYLINFSTANALSKSNDCEQVSIIYQNSNINDDIEINSLSDDLDALLKSCYSLKESNGTGIVEYIIALIYFEKKEIKSFELNLIKSIENGYDAYDEIIRLYYYGYETDQYTVQIDTDKFLKYSLEGADQNSAKALYHLGYEYKYGGVTEINKVKALEYLGKSANLGLIFSKLELIDLESINSFQSLNELELLVNSKEVKNTKTTFALEFIYWHASQYAAMIHKYDKSINYAKKVIDLVTKRKGEDFENLAYDYMILADAYNKAGNFFKALEAVNKALEIHNISFAREDSYLMQIFTRKALILENISRNSEALSLYKKIDQYYASAPHDIFLGDHVTSQFKIAENYLIKGDLINSKKYLTKAKKGSLEAYGYIKDMHLPIIIKALIRNNEINELNSLMTNELYDRKKQDIYSYAEALKIFSEFYFLETDLLKCIDFMNESIEINSQILSKNNINIIESKYILANCYKKNNQPEKSRKLFLEISNAFLDNRNLEIYEINNLFIDVFFNHLQNVTKEKNDFSKIFDLVKLLDSRNKHSSIKDLFIREYIDNIELKDALFKKETLKKQIIAIDKELFGIRTSAQIDRDLERDYLDQVKTLKISLEDLNKKITKVFPDLNFLLNKSNTSLNDIKALMSEDEKIIIYTSYKNNLIILLISKDDHEIKIIDNNYDSIVDDVNKLRDLLQDPYSQSTSYSVAKSLYDKILYPIEHILNKKDKIIIINDEELSSLPFSSLIDIEISGSNFSKQEWLLKKYNFAYLPSIDSYFLLKKIKQKNYKTQFFGIGNPNFDGVFVQLPNTEDEIKKISSNFDEHKTEIFLGSRANEEILKNKNINSKFLMFATHAITAEEVEKINDPAIVLSLESNSIEDGYLTSTDIINTKFESDLLILSACNTAKPDPSGKYFSGLTRSFLYSGSKNLLATLWGIETFSAEELTTNFFKTSSFQYSVSLKNAQLELLNSNKYSHPFYWSPYILIGVN